MIVKLNAEIVLNVPEDTELTNDQLSAVILTAERRMNGIEVINVSQLENLMIGVRVHIHDTEAAGGAEEFIE